MLRNFFILMPCVLLVVDQVKADIVYTPISLAGVANGRLQLLHPDYPTGDEVLLGGVPFNLPAQGRNTWYSSFAANGGAGTVSITIPVNVSGATGVHTLINTLWGRASTPSLASLTFNFDDGSNFVKQLIGDVDIRDYYNNVFTNSINNTSSVRVFFTDTDGPEGPNRYRLDKQFIDLSAFSQKTLVSLTLSDSGNQNLQRAFLAGMTIQSVPEPSSLVILALGATGAIAFSRRTISRRRPA